MTDEDKRDLALYNAVYYQQNKERIAAQRASYRARNLDAVRERERNSNRRRRLELHEGVADEL